MCNFPLFKNKLNISYFDKYNLFKRGFSLYNNQYIFSKTILNGKWTFENNQDSNINNSYILGYHSNYSNMEDKNKQSNILNINNFKFILKNSDLKLSINNFLYSKKNYYIHSNLNDISCNFFYVLNDTNQIIYFRLDMNSLYFNSQLYNTELNYQDLENYKPFLI